MLGAEIIDGVRREIRSIASNFEIDDYDNALADAGRETGWSTSSNSDAFQILWLKNRTKRHLFFFLLSESAHKFKFKQINLQHRFDHYRAIVRDMDRAFEKAIEERPEKFAGVSLTHIFGHKIDAGFAYDEAGRDITYRDENVVQVGPSDSD